MIRTQLFIGLFSLLLLGCGQQGALYLPEATKPDTPAADEPVATEKSAS